MTVCGNCVRHGGLLATCSAWRFAAIAVCVAVGRNLVLYGGGFCFVLFLLFFVILSLTQNLRNGCESVGAELIDAESSSA